MKKVAKAILIALAGLIVVAVVVILAVNLYVQSPGARTRIQEELSKALNTPVNITNTSLSPWGGLRINGISVPGEHGSLLEASSFSAGYRLLPLFRRELVISDITMNRPSLVWPQNAEGRWVWPELSPKKDDASGSEAAESEEKPKRDKEEKGFRVSIDGFRINSGSIDLLDAEQQPIATFRDVNLHYKERRRGVLKGEGSVARVTFRDGLALENLQTPFTVDDGKLDISKLEAKIGGGTLQVEVQVETDEKKKTPFKGKLQLDQVDLAQVALQAGWPAGSIGGVIAGNLQLEGDGRKMARAKGPGQLVLTNGQFRQLDFFKTIGTVLGISELADLRLHNARADFHLADEKVFVDKLLMEATELQLSAKGIARFDRALSLDAQLAVSDRIQLPNFVKQNFVAAEKPGYQAIDFKISGRTDRPKTDLAGKLIGRKYGEQLESLVTTIFGGGGKKTEDKGEKKERKKKDQPASDAAPAPAPGTP